MRQSTRKYVMFFGATMAVAGGLFAAACGTDNGGTSSGTLPTAEGGGGDKPNTPPPPPPPGSGDGGDGGTDPDCSAAPKLRTNTTDFYCAFVNKDAGTDGGDGGQSASFCQNNEICCNPSTKTGSNFDPSFCQFDPTKGGHDVLTAEDVCRQAAPGRGFTWPAADGGSFWECADKNNCPSGKVCCLTSNAGATATNAANIGKSTDKSIPTACNALQAFKESGTVCKTSCAAGTEIQLCSQSDNNCGAGTTCTAFTGFFRDLGVCR